MAAGKALEKALKDATKSGKCIMGTKEVLGSMSGSKLLVLSASLGERRTEEILAAASSSNVPSVRFEGSSVSLGRLCGRQYRVSVAAFTSITEASVRSIQDESRR